MNTKGDTDLKNATGNDTSKFAKKFHLDNLEYIVDELDIYKYQLI